MFDDTPEAETRRRAELEDELRDIGPIGQWVLQTACPQVAEWRIQRVAPVRVAVNVSARQLGDRRLAEIVDDAFGRPRCRPRR